MAEEGHGRLLNGLSDNSGESFDQDQSTLNTSINQHAFHILKVEGWFSKLCPYVNFPANWIWKRIQWIQHVVKVAKGKTGDSLNVFLEEPIDFNFITDCLPVVPAKV